jgi:hypothetical protein
MNSLLPRFLIAVVLLCLVPDLTAQDTASITGTVEDKTGAVIAGAQIVVSAPAKGLIRTTVSNSVGEYLVAGLATGSYELTVSAPGFSKYQVNNVALEVAQKLRLDTPLDLVIVRNEVTVQGDEIARIDTQSADLAGTVNGREISQLELNGRNFTQLVSQVPGVNNQTGQDEGVVGPFGSVLFSINGGRGEYNNWEIDGGDAMDNGSNQTLNIYPNIDAIAEFRVMTSNYGAQYGRNGSGTIEVVTKSGTKDFHGDVFEFARNEVFNARNYFDGVTKPPYKRHDYGYTLGGPVFIPSHYNARKDKTFFFFSEEWRRESNPTTFDVQVPSLGERMGNFSDVCPADPASFTRNSFPDCPTDPNTGAPFPNNQLSIDPNGALLLPMISPPTTGSGPLSFFRASRSTPTRWREELLHMDHHINSKLSTAFRYIHDSWRTITPTAFAYANFPTIQTDYVGPGVSAVAHLTYSASPTLLNEFTFSYTTDHIVWTNVGNWQRPPTMTMTALFNNGSGGKLPGIKIVGGNAYGGGFGQDAGVSPWSNSNPTYTYRDSVTKNTGRHNLQFGAYAATAQKNEDNFDEIQGTLTFNNTSPVSTGNAFADLLIGRISAFQQTSLQTKYYNRYKILESYFEDDWHVRHNLTLNLGLRVSLFGTYRDRYKRTYNFESEVYNRATAPKIDIDGSQTRQPGALIPGSGNPFDGMVLCGGPGVPAGCMRGHLFNPAPRLGFSWDPTGRGKTAIRGGYGIFFEHTNGNEATTESLEGSPPLVLSPTEFNVVGYTNIGGSGLLFPLGVTAIPTKAIWPYVQQWHLDVQREVLKKTLATLAYVGSKGTHLTLQRDLNQIPSLSVSQNPFGPGQPLNSNVCLGAPFSSGQGVNGVSITQQAAINLSVACGMDPDPYRPILGYGTIALVGEGASSIYHSLQASLRRTVGVLTINVAYTYSHSIDNSSDRFDRAFVDSYNLRGSRASSSFDQRHIFNFSYVYDIPSFRAPGLGQKLFEGWQISGIIIAQTGTPFTVGNGVFGDNAGVGNGLAPYGAGSYPDIIGNPNTPPPVASVPGIIGPLLYNPSVFFAPRGLTFGKAGRNLLTSPARLNFDAGIFKHFPVHEKTAIEFRAEAFNVFNHTQWSGVNNNVYRYGGPNNSAGDPSCLASSPFLHPNGAHRARTLQFGLKFIF